MKYIVLTGALAIALCTGACEAEDNKPKPDAQVAAGQAAQGASCLKHIDLGDSDEKSVTSVGVMDAGQNYDASTGFPNVVKSDSDMDVQ